MESAVLYWLGCGVLDAVRARRARGEERARRDPDRAG